MKHFSKKIMKSLAILLTCTLTLPLATPAFAWYCPPPPPPVHHYHHSSDNSAAWGLGGLAAGLLLGAVISNSSKERKPPAPKEPEITDVEERLTAFSAQALLEAQKAIAQYGIDDGLSKINDYWMAQSYDAIYDPIGLKLSVTDSKRQFKLTYLIDRMTPEIEVTIIHLSSGRSSLRRGELTPPGCAKKPRSTPWQNQTQTYSTLDLLGFSLSANRSNGYLTVKEVEVGTVAYLAGLRTGTPIIAIDGNNTTQMMHDQMEAYISKRAETGNVVKVQFKTSNGALKTAVLKPKL